MKSKAVLKPHPIRIRLAHETHGVDVWRFGGGAVIQALRADLKAVLDENDELVVELLKTRKERDSAQEKLTFVLSFLEKLSHPEPGDEGALQNIETKAAELAAAVKKGLGAP